METFINDWIAASNAFGTKKYLEFYLEEAVLDDPSLVENLKDIKAFKNILTIISLVTIRKPNW